MDLKIEDLVCTFSKVVPKGKVLEVNQTHSSLIIELEKVQSTPKLIEGDGISWEKGELGPQDQLVVKTADCLSLLLLGKKRRYLIHAGWRGLANGILNIPKEIGHAFIFPHIQLCCFEVTEEFQDHFPNSPHFLNKDNKLFFNLKNKAAEELQAKFPHIIIKSSPVCTCCSSERFHSFRRDKTHLRNYTLIKIK